MLPDKNRLASNEFEVVKEKGRLSSYPHYSAVVYNRKDSLPSRFGFVVSTKVAKEASRRNRVKRAMRQAVRQSLSYIGSGYSVVFLAKPSIVKVYTNEIMIEGRNFLDEKLAK